jgi:hypothetical protein
MVIEQVKGLQQCERSVQQPQLHPFSERLYLDTESLRGKLHRFDCSEPIVSGNILIFRDASSRRTVHESL